MTFSIPSKAEDDAVVYVTSRQGKDGGYLFYQYDDVFESAVDDTYYALAVLNWFQVIPPRADLTLKFLNFKIGKVDLYAAYYVVNALLILCDRLGCPSNLYLSPVRNKWSRLLRLTIPDLVHSIRDSSEAWTPISKPTSEEMYSIELPSKLELMFMVLDLSNKVGFDLHRNVIKEEIAKNMVEYFESDRSSSFATLNMSLIFYALGILRILGYPFDGLRGLAEFIFKCEDMQGGFNITPYSRFRTLEYTYKAIKVLRWLGLIPRSIKSHRRFVLECQNVNGGFRRSLFSGISTLRDTFYAVGALRNLSGQA
ncbi:MAG: prenyltransferase/squalene oxidase repeat-containing protein [Nitrososphaeria archaeon]